MLTRGGVRGRLRARVPGALRTRAPGAVRARATLGALRVRLARAWICAVPGALLAGVAPCVHAQGALAFDVQAHRGGRGLAPENTLAAFRRALALGVTTLETDVAFTRDDVPVLAHDRRLNPVLVRGPDGAWLAQPGPPIRALTLAELARYDVGRVDPASDYGRTWASQRPADGERIPTLRALFALAAEHVAAGGAPPRFNLETKLAPDSGDETLPAPEYARALVDAVRSARMADRVTIQSFDWRTLLEVRRLAPEIPTSCLTIVSPGMDTVSADASGVSPWQAGVRATPPESLPARVRAAGCTVWSMYWRNLGVSSLQEAKALGLRVLPWTVNDPAQMERLIDMGVDGIITDYPDRLRAVMLRRSMPVPPAGPLR